MIGIFFRKLRSSRRAALTVLTLSALPVVLLLLGRFTHLDLWLADAMFDPVTRNFPWREHWLANRFAHVWLKFALVVVGAVVVVATIADAFRRFSFWSDDFRTRMRLLACSAALVPLVIGALKRFSATHCPWDVERYGGQMPYFRLLDALPDGIVPGHCFPAGHASSALWLVALAVFWLPHRPRMAGMVGGLMLSFGLLLGWLQQMRGAHFLSHTLWSMWIACVIVAILYVAFILPKAAREQV
ncbi:MAG: acid phosphatase [Burkholderiaceae bacterium]|nr:acid phosphatase [Burkholderiaceae bacterium]